MRLKRSFGLGTVMLLGACSVDPSSSASFPDAPAGGVDAGAGNGGAGGSQGSAGSGATADAGGSSSSGGPVSSADDTAGCAAHVVMGTRAMPDMLVVLDRSGSMNPDGNDDDTDRWGGSRMALIDVTAAFGDKVRFGLMTFPGAAGQDDDDDDDSSCAAGTVNVPVGINAGPTIATTLQGMDADGRTPTAATLRAALPVIAASVAPDQTIPPKYVLLVTDGDPNCSANAGGGGRGGGGGGRDDTARTETIQAIEALAAAGVKTFVVGYQTAGTDFADQLDRMAAAGGTGEMRHRSVASGMDLNTTFSEIAANVISCSYQLPSAVADASKVLVRVATRPRNLNNAADGWRLEPDKRTVTLTGAACEEVRNSATFAVQVTCETVPLF